MYTIERERERDLILTSLFLRINFIVLSFKKYDQLIKSLIFNCLHLWFIYFYKINRWIKIVCVCVYSRKRMNIYIYFCMIGFSFFFLKKRLYSFKKQHFHSSFKWLRKNRKQQILINYYYFFFRFEIISIPKLSVCYLN